MNVEDGPELLARIHFNREDMSLDRHGHVFRRSSLDLIETITVLAIGRVAFYASLFVHEWRGWKLELNSKPLIGEILIHFPTI